MHLAVGSCADGSNLSDTGAEVDYSFWGLWTGNGDDEDEQNVDLVLGVHPDSSLQELLSLVPPRLDVDRTL
jgi:hypothetical protein